MTERPRQFPHQIVVRVSDELYEALQEDAEHYGRTVTQSARFAMARWLNVGIKSGEALRAVKFDTYTPEPGIQWHSSGLTDASGDERRSSVDTSGDRL